MPRRKKNKQRKSNVSKNEEEQKKEENLIDNEENEINIISDEDKNKDDLFKITNIEYEKFIRLNEKLFEYIKKSKPTIVVNNDKFNSEINLESESLIKIIKKANLENEFKIYLTMQIISEKINFESNKNLSFNPNTLNYINKIKKYNITFPSNPTSISLDKKIFEKIFSLMNLDYSKDIFNYIEFIVTQISYKYEKKQKNYIIKGMKNLNKLMQEKKIFYFLLKNGNDKIIPLSNYSTQKIFDLFNGGKNTKYLLINYKIKNDEQLEEENTNKFFLDKLINASDVKNILIKYKQKTNNNSLKILEKNQLQKMKEINISDLDDYLFKASDKLLKILEQIKIKKEEIIKKSENENNQIVLITLEGKNKFINKQYLQQFDTKNLYSMDIYDYSNKKITLTKKNIEKINEENIYVEINFDKKFYLIKKNNLLKMCDSWKTLNQSEIIDVIDINEFKSDKINIELLNIIIIDQDIIKDYNEDLGNNKNKINIFEYVQNLPKKKVYNIKYKVKVKRVPKIKKLNS